MRYAAASKDKGSCQVFTPSVGSGRVGRAFFVEDRHQFAQMRLRVTGVGFKLVAGL